MLIYLTFNNSYDYFFDSILNDNSISFYGIDNSEHMVKRANTKKLQENNNIRFIQHDSTDPKICNYFEESNTNIVMCLYNTLGVIPSDKRQAFVDNMLDVAGEDGLAILTAFNGDNFGFVAPKMYHPMLPMIRTIDDDSFDEKNRVFQNSLGFRSQWFTKPQLQSFLHSDVEPLPINVRLDGKSFTFGNVFLSRKS